MQPGQGRDGLAIYAFYNSGVQIFNLDDPTKPEIADYFVPRYPTAAEMPDWTYNTAGFAVFTEYDRNIIWFFTTQGVFALRSPLLGDPVVGPPSDVWPPRG